MGRQINFYMSENVQLCFLGYLKKEKFLFLDKNRRIIKEPNAKEVFGMYLYKADYGSIIMRQDDKEYMDSIKSPVIQYNKTMIKGETKQIIRGRLWIANQYNDEDGRQIKKDDLFLRDYQMLVRWIKKMFHIRKLRRESI